METAEMMLDLLPLKEALLHLFVVYFLGLLCFGIAAGVRHNREKHR